MSTEYPPSPSSPEPICCVDDNHQAQNNLTALESAILRDLKMLSYPEPDWVHSRPGILDVLIIGGGQGGLSIAFGLLREKVRNILIIDENPSGREGPWRTFARMKTLRSPKHLTGPDLGIPNLTFQSWYEARFGREAFDNLHLAPKDIWADYLDWYRKLLQLPVQNNTKAGAIQWNEEKQCFAIPITNPNGMDTLLARKVVLATGIDGSGQWDVPAIIRNQVSPHLYAHTHDPIDFEALQGKRIGILGAGASAFDNAITALEVGAQEAHLFFRRAQLPNINPFRWGLFSGYLNHHSDLPDPDRWRFMLYLTRMGMPPPPDTLASALKLPGFHLHPGSPWHRVSQIGKTIRVETPHGQFEFDYLIAGTGTITDLSLRPELAYLSPDIATWQDRYTPPETEQHSDLARSPYLGTSFECQEKVPGTVPYITGLFNFTYGAMVSHGTSGSAIHGIKYSVPKIVSGITRQLYVEDRDDFYRSMLDFSITEFELDATILSPEPACQPN